MVTVLLKSLRSRYHAIYEHTVVGLASALGSRRIQASQPLAVSTKATPPYNPEEEQVVAA